MGCRYIVGMLAARIRLGVLALACACDDDAPLHGVIVNPPQAAPVVRIADATGQVVDLDAEHGRRSVLLFFGYTHCPDVCPATLADWARARRALGRAANGVRFVFVSVDPARDTPAIARDYALQFDSSFTGLAPTAAQLDSLQRTWGFAVALESAGLKPGDYGVTHPAGSFLIDRAGMIRVIYPPVVSSDDLASDLRRVR